MVGILVSLSDGLVSGLLLLVLGRVGIVCYEFSFHHLENPGQP